MQLRSELREKEMKLTDIRLEALSSAHQLDQLREAMNRMQVCKQPAEQLQHRRSERKEAWQTVFCIISNPNFKEVALDQRWANFLTRRPHWVERWSGAAADEWRLLLTKILWDK